ncbi:MerR family transcriptional regulator [Sphingomonas cavernae]|uniref:MerR family transcriptional regulator n=1 Tax=Sphingomonas cavernae TaxID=2320861 RepID=A0A418WRL0_9SPHN|nr:MerR family transcriptional regulator [Sphingomonas cavernae]RJF93875.1 MerR family transcriptional regulator [Sphingomonas cavernae]
MADKAEGAFLTISELADDLGLPQHILRYWESRFPQLRPLQRAGKRRYYRPEDVALARKIHSLLNQEGYTIKGVQKLLGNKANGATATAAPAPAPAETGSFTDIGALRRIRAQLADALASA